MPENRLVNEKSPYLLQHAQNPVDWWPWCQEVFERAKAEDKPIFLSIGYSTCHWCHVMAHESFEDPEVARRLNAAFYAVKVDREERPDIDGVYMEACLALMGSGGWPLNILMTAEGKPFWAGTYLPPRGRLGAMGLLELLERTEELWRTDRKSLLAAGDALARQLSHREDTPGLAPDRTVLHRAVDQLRRSFDREYGGFGTAPKFPTPHNLLFLLAYARQEERVEALDMAERTLTQMARGGIFDQIGGGFCRYAVDRRWLVPHFEKMLYDNALLAFTYLTAAAQTGRRLYRETARRTLDYALEELRLPGGGFACGQDADSGGEEGKFYLLTPREVAQTLAVGETEELCTWLDITEAGNFEGRSIPNRLRSRPGDAPPEDLEKKLRALWRYRRGRMPLHRDDKVLTGWNGLMIAALARGYRVMGDPRYLRAAETARIFLKTRLTTPEGRLLRRWRDREAAVEGQLEDYAYYLWGLLELYGANFSARVLREAVNLADRMAADFWDEEEGGFFSTAHHAPRLIARRKDIYDGALPSGNAVAGLVLSRLGKLTGRQDYRDLARRQLEFLTGSLWEYPSAHCFGLLALMEELYPTRELVCTAARWPGADLSRLAERAHTLVKTPENQRALDRLAPFTADYPVPGEGEVYYLCEDGACLAPIHDKETLAARLGQ